jgi:hypothetical protein
MAKRAGPEQVADYFDKLEHPLKPAMMTIREAILSAEPAITEQIKWNAPSFCYEGDDRVTFNINRSGTVLLIFHRGAKAKDRNGVGRLIEDSTGLLNWITDDRATVELANNADAEAAAPQITQLVREWIQRS